MLTQHLGRIICSSSTHWGGRGNADEAAPLPFGDEETLPPNARNLASEHPRGAVYHSLKFSAIP